MSRGLKRIYGGGEFHFITCSCYERRPFLRFAHRRDIFLRILEEVRQRYRFIIAGYVVMPEHVHLLMGEPDYCTPSSVMRALKQRVARKLLPELRSRGSREFSAKLWEPAFTTPTCTASRSMLKSCGISTAIPSDVAWWINQRTGSGAAIVSIQKESRDQLS
jgi:REP element-mobilizing transposase RayT